MKHALSSYLVKHIFVITWKAGVNLESRDPWASVPGPGCAGEPPELGSALLLFPSPSPLTPQLCQHPRGEPVLSPGVHMAVM